MVGRLAAGYEYRHRKKRSQVAFPEQRSYEGRGTSHYATVPREEMEDLGISSASVPRS